MPERENNGRKTIEEVQRLRARVAKLERIALGKAGPKDADRELDRAWSEWETTFDAIGDSVILLDSEFNIVQANAATSSLLGKPLDEIVGQRCCKLVHGSDEPLEDCPLIKTKTTKKREKAELYVGEKGIWALVSVDPILDEQGNLTGAVHIIRDITDRKKAEHALGESEERFRKVFEDGPMGMVMADPGTARFVRANGVFCRMLGYTEEELQRMTFLDITHPEHREQDEKQVKKLWAGEIPFYKAEKRYICKNREVLWGALTATVVCGADGKPLYSLAMVEDITERKKAEEALQRSVRLLRDTGEMAKVGGWELDLSTNEVSWTEEVGRIHGVEPGYKPKLEEALNFYAPESRAAVEAVVKKTAETGEPYDLESLFIPLGGKDKIWVRSLGKAVYSGGKIVKLAGTFQNIDKYRRAEEALRETTQTLEAVIRASPLPIFAVDRERIVKAWNPAAERTFGWSAQEIVGRPYPAIPKEKMDEANAFFSRALESGLTEVETLRQTKDGSLMDVSISAAPLRDSRGNITGVMAVIADITERRKANEVLRESEERYRSFVHNFRGIAFRGRMDFTPIFFHGAVEQITGYTEKELIDGKPRWDQVIHPEDLPALMTEDEERLHSTPHYSYEREYRIVRKDGTVRSVHEVIQNVCDDSGKPAVVQGAIYDITERKKAEEKIKIFSDAVASAFDCLMLTDSKGNFTYANESACTTFGYTPEEFLKLDITKLDADPEVAKKIAQETTAKGKWSGEVINIRRNGEEFPSLLSAFIIRDEQGNPKGTMGILRDITDRKKAEQQVRQSEQKYKELFESAREAIIIMDLNGKITDANRAVEEYGHTRDYLLGKSIFDFIPVNHRARAAKDFDELCHGTAVKGEMEVIGPKGNLTVEYSDNPIVRGGQIVAVQAILTDITERKKATDGLIRLTKILKTVARVNQDIFLIKDRKELLRSVCSRIVGHPYKMVWIGFCDEPTKAVVPAAQAGFDEGYLNSIKVTYDDSEYGRGPTGTAIRTNKPCAVRSTAKDPTYHLPWRKEALKRGYRSSAAIPIVSGKRVIGALNVYSEKEDAFGDEEIGLLEELVRDISTGLWAIDEENKRKQAEKRLKTYQAELKSLASELLLTEERERRRIAAGIHDDIGQKLALAKMELQLLARPPGNSRIPASLDSVCARIDEVIKDAHSLTFELSNPALYDLRFAAAIDLWLLERIQKKHGIKCTVIADEQGVPLAENSKVVLFRALRELAVNVVKHAKATALTVTIEKLEGSVQITCKDDGLGFTPPKGGALPSDVGGFGLFNIKERLEYLGGSMKLESAPGRGTLITLSLPLERQNDAGADEGRQ